MEYYALKENIFKFDSLLQQHGDQHPDVKRLKVNKENMEKNIKEKVSNNLKLLILVICRRPSFRSSLA